MWKTRFGRCIYQSSSGFRVMQNPWFRWLTFAEDDLQTLMLRRHPERGGLHYIAPIVQMVLTSPGDCCMLGLGGAGIAHALFPGLANMNFTAVELNQEIIDIAQHFFYTDRIQNLNIVHQHADDFVQSSTKTFQHVIIDLHDGQHYPTACDHDVFFDHCKALLKTEGMLTVNLLNIHTQMARFQRIKMKFNLCTLIVPVAGTGNTLVFAFNVSNSRLFLEKLQSIPFLKGLTWHPSWGWMGYLGAS
jgi:spermidine synthase